MAAADEQPDIFAALADPTRRWIVRQLAQSGATTPTALAAALPISRQAVSRHLAVLRDCQVVTVETRGREQHYQLAVDPLRDAAAWLAAIEHEWDARLAGLGRLLEGDA
jgi:DNA-binding transcriptional ArsR family regulator